MAYKPRGTPTFVEDVKGNIGLELPSGKRAGVVTYTEEDGIMAGGEAIGGAGAQVPSDWNAVAGVARILNKPTVLDAEAVQDLVAAMFAGSHTNLTATYNDATGTLTLSAASGGGGTTAEEVQDFLNTALVHANHTGVTVSYDDANNRFVFTAAGGGGTGAPIYRKLTVTANGVTGAVLLVGHGSAGDLAQATATAAADGGTVTISGLPASFDLTSVTANTPAGFNTATAFNLVFPCPFAIAALDDHPLATLLHYNSAAPAMLQAQTNIGVNVSAGIITLTKTSLVAGTAARWKALIQ